MPPIPDSVPLATIPKARATASGWFPGQKVTARRIGGFVVVFAVGVDPAWQEYAVGFGFHLMHR
jgi:hypothetical protein